LLLVEKDPYYRDEVKKFAQKLRLDFFGNQEIVYIPKGNYREHVQMEKFFSGVVNDLFNEQEATPQMKRYVKEKMKTVNFQQLVGKDK